MFSADSTAVKIDTSETNYFGTTTTGTSIPTSSSISGRVLESIKAYMDKRKFAHSVHSVDENHSVIKARLAGDSGAYDVILLALEELRNLVIIYVLNNLKFPQAHRIKLCEYMARANNSLLLGNMITMKEECDTRVQRRSVRKACHMKSWIDRMVMISLGTMDRCFENMVKVGYGVMEPKDATENIIENLLVDV